MTGETVLAERRANVLLLTLNRPDRLNAWTDELEDRYFDLLEGAERDPEIRAVVVTGAGRGFCSGADMALLQAAGEREGPPPVQRTRPRTFPLTVRMPLIAAINGAAAGLGLVEALYCDVRFAAPTARFTTSFARRGLIAEYGLSWILPRLVGQAHALDLLLSGRVIEGEEAHAIGLVNRVIEPDALVEETVAYAQELATYCSPTAMATIKAQVQRDLDATFEQAVATSEALMLESLTWPDLREGVASHTERRPPTFPPLVAGS